MVKFDPEAVRDFELKKSEWAAEKQQRWDLRTLKQFLTKTGMPSSQLSGLERQAGDTFGWDWFNDSGYFPGHRIHAARELKYNFEALIFAKAKDPVLTRWSDFKDGDRESPCSMIFRCATFGGKGEPMSLVLTDWEIENVLETCPEGWITGRLRLSWEGINLTVLLFSTFCDIIHSHHSLPWGEE